MFLQEIERLKNEKPTWERRVRWDGMKAVFGGPPSLLWCNPFTGLRLRRLMLLPHGRRGGSEFSVWEGGGKLSLRQDLSCTLGWSSDGPLLPEDARCVSGRDRLVTTTPRKSLCSNPHMLESTQHLWQVLEITVVSILTWPAFPLCLGFGRACSI